MFIIAISVIGVLRLLDGNYGNALIDFVAVLLAVAAIGLGRLGKFNLAVWVIAITPVLAAFFLAYFEIVNGLRIVPQLTLSMVTSLLLFTDSRYRITYIIACLVLVALVSLKVDGDWLKTIIFLTQITAFAVIFSAFIYFFEKLDRNLHETIERLEASNVEKNSANQELNERVEELVVFSHIMTHDLKSPLTSILGFADLIKLDIVEGAVNADSLESVEAISSAAESMDSLITNLLTYSRVSLAEGELEAVDMAAILPKVTELLDFQLRQAEAAVEVGELHPIQGNTEMFKTVLQNLISNAIKYQPKDRLGHKPVVWVWSEEGADTVSLYVRDNGIGIDEAYLPKLFTPFQRFHTHEAYDGTGLGMSICDSIVRKYNGTIEVAKTGPSGTTFRLCFPQVSPGNTVSPIG